MKLQWPGRSPWDETWFIEGMLDDGRGLWLRYTLCHGRPNTAATWAILSSATGVTGGWRPVSLSRLTRDPTACFSLDEQVLTVDRSRGSVQGLAWDLHLTHAAASYSLVPDPLARLGRTYRTESPSLHFEGTLVVDGEPQQVRGRGVLGHLYGARSRLRRWSWVHARDASGQGAEILVGELAVAGMPLPPLVSATVWHEGHTAHLHRLSTAVRGWATWRGDSVYFKLRQDSMTVQGAATLHGPSTALVRYTQADGRQAFCRNSPFSRVELSVHRDGEDPWFWSTTTAAVEHGSPYRPAGRVVAG